MKAAELVMLQSWRKPAKLFSDFNTLQFACVMGVILLVIILVLMGDTRPHDARRVPVDMPKVLHPVPMRDADRDDAMLLAITRDGKVYFRSEQINVVSLPVKIEDHLKGPGVEPKVYIFADARSRWGLVKLVIDAVRTAGVVRVAFMTDQRHPIRFPKERTSLAYSRARTRGGLAHAIDRVRPVTKTIDIASGQAAELRSAGQPGRLSPHGW